MTLYESRDLLVSVLAVLVNLAALVFLGLQIRQATKAAKEANTERSEEWAQRRRESTLQFYMSTMEKREAYKITLPSDRDAVAIAKLIERANNDREIHHAITMYVNYHEMLATGIHSNVLDIDVIDKFAGSNVIAVWNNYLPWIVEQRIKYRTPTLSDGFEQVAKTFSVMRNAPIRSSSAVLQELTQAGENHQPDTRQAGKTCGE